MVKASDALIPRMGKEKGRICCRFDANEYAYCPRLFHLMHVEGRWADNAYTVEPQRSSPGGQARPRHLIPTTLQPRRNKALW